jgi:hypothetical protein
MNKSVINCQTNFVVMFVEMMVTDYRQIDPFYTGNIKGYLFLRILANKRYQFKVY